MTSLLSLSPTVSATTAPFDTQHSQQTAPVGSHRDMHAQFANARRLWQTGKLQAAAELYEALIERAPDLPEAYNNLAVIYAAQGHYKKAQAMLEKGLNTDPSYAAIYENLTAIYVEMARNSYGKALQYAKDADRQLKLRALASISSKPVEPAAKPAPVVALQAKPPAKPPVKLPVKPRTVAMKSEAPLPTPTAPAAATSVIKPAPAVTKVAADTPQKDSAIQALREWARAWSEQAVAKYLSFYDSAFLPPRGMSRRYWKMQRTIRLQRPEWIRVSLSDFKVNSEQANQVRVQARQVYQSDTYSDRSHKEFVMRATENGWRIVSERSLK